MSAIPHSPDRRVVFVAGAGRSGTSSMSGLLRILGMHVPQPEIVADETNPKGFGEPSWVVETHDRMLGLAGVQVSDSRPQAWDLAREVAERDVEQQRAAAWLAEHLADHPALVVKDPRLSWFLPMWRSAAQRNDATLGFVTMLRPPAEVVGSKRKYYNALNSPSHLAASWVNMLLHTEHETRSAGGGRAFVRYADLLQDWRGTAAHVNSSLGVALSEDPDRVAEADSFIDPALRRVTPDLAELGLAPPLHDLVMDTWNELAALGQPGGDTPDAQARLDELRETYAGLYQAAEDMSTSSRIAARREVRREMRQKFKAERDRVDYEPIPGNRRRVDLIPHEVRALVPAGVRRGVRRALRRPR
ncbi:hypothetical protein KUV85_15630 [Nocardioides panacisoli]|uniref:sulfotransferase family protein n=1 Tax=Nocardioides panacisoli TaxID=627624 RepID=UPI001C6376F1|nr:hypothetical protein [Nocardioides panacisoli]QYJ03737.1 hypothetical protein KUV85_15630 [Nocardioides panacisoli]